MKKTLLKLLAVSLCCASLFGAVCPALAEEIVLSEPVEPEAGAADWVGDNGLVMEDGDTSLGAAAASDAVTPFESDLNLSLPDPDCGSDGDSDQQYQGEAQPGQSRPAEAPDAGEPAADTRPEEEAVGATQPAENWSEETQIAETQLEEGQPDAAIQPSEAITAEQPAEDAQAAAEVSAAADEAGEAVPSQAVDLALSATKLSIGLRESTGILTATTLPEGSTGEVRWESKKPEIVKVNAETGRLTGVKKGTAVVVARMGDVEKRCTVKVLAAPNKVAVSPEKLTLSVGQTWTLSAKLPAKTASTISYKSKKKRVASVDQAGVITALKPGKAKITATTFNKKTATCQLTVLAAPEQVFLPEAINLLEGEHQTLAATVESANGAKSTADYTFSVEDDAGVVSVNAATGEIVGLKCGVARIRVSTHNGVTTHLEDGAPVDTVCTVTVSEGPASVQFAAKSVTIGLKQTLALEPEALDAEGNPMKGVQLKIASGNKERASVTSAGVVKGLKTGSCTITATALNGARGTCTVKVVKAPSKVTVTAPVIGVGQSAALTVSFPKGTMASCKYTSGTPSVASVNSAGIITGHKPGTAVIKVKTHNGKEGKATVTVTKGPEYLTLNGDYEMVFDPLTNSYAAQYKKELSTGKTFRISVENEYMTCGDVASYESLSPAVATVDGEGLVTAVGPGSAVIVVRSTSGAEARLLVTVPGKLPAEIAFAVTEAQVQAGRAVPVPALEGSNIEAAQLAAASYTSGDANIFTVGWSDEEACWMLTGVNPGAAELTATVAGATAALKVTVSPTLDIAELRFENDLVYLKPGEAFAPPVTDEYGNIVAATLSSDSSAIVSVGENGLLTAVAEGNAVITASYGALSASMTVRVRGELTAVTLGETALKLGVGQRHTLKASVNGDGASALLTFTSSNPAVASVNRSGRIIARSAGTAVITASAGEGSTAGCTVDVVPAPTRISLEPAELCGRLDEGGAQLSWAFGAPDELGTVRFTSANEDVATVDGKGYVTFVKVGATTIGVTTSNGLTASIPVTVLPKVPVSETPTYRLFAAYSYFNTAYKGYIPFSKHNAESVAGVFRKSSVSGLTYSTKVVGNPSKAQLLSGIAGYFSETTDVDVSVVYLCSHGHMEGNYTDYRMSLPGYAESPTNPNYYLTSAEIMNCVSRIRGNVVLILDSCYSGAFLEDMWDRLNAQGGRIAVLTAASDTRATYYNVKDTNKAVDFFTFFLLTGLGYNERENWWNANKAGKKGKYPGFLAADIAGNDDGIVTLGEFYSFAENSISVNIPNYMKRSWYWGDKQIAQATRWYAGNLGDLVIYQPK